MRPSVERGAPPSASALRGDWARVLFPRPDRERAASGHRGSASPFLVPIVWGMIIAVAVYRGFVRPARAVLRRRPPRWTSRSLRLVSDSDWP